MIVSLDALEIGRTYEAQLDDDGRPVLTEVVTRGRKRALSGDQIIAARALRALGYKITRITDILNERQGLFGVSPTAVRTALFGR